MPSSIRHALDKCWQVDGSLKPEDVLWFTRGLRRSPFAELPDKPMEETFIWIVEPPDGLLEGDLYTDGSLKDNEACLEGKCVALGWAFVVFDVDGKISAAAHGCPPGWVTTIYGAELWAVQMVMQRAMPGAVKILSDCQSVQKDCARGAKWSTSPTRTYARVWAVVKAASDDGTTTPIVWMPAHTAEHEVGIRVKSDGTVLTARDRHANDTADRFAKTAAEGRRFKRNLRDMVKQEAEELAEMAIWLAKVTMHANKFPLPDGTAIRDSQAAQPRARKTRGRKRKQGEPDSSEVAELSTAAHLHKLPRLDSPLPRREIGQTGKPSSSSSREDRPPKASSGPVWPPASWPPSSFSSHGVRQHQRQRGRQALPMSRFAAEPASRFLSAPAAPAVTVSVPKASAVPVFAGAALTAAEAAAEALRSLKELQQSGLSVKWPCRNRGSAPAGPPRRAGEEVHLSPGIGPGSEPMPAGPLTEAEEALAELHDLQACGLHVTWPAARLR